MRDKQSLTGSFPFLHTAAPLSQESRWRSISFFNLYRLILGGALLLMAMLMVGTALPPSIAAVGIFEGLTILALGTFDVPHETALAIGLTLHAVAFVPQTLIAAILVVLRPTTMNALKNT